MKVPADLKKIMDTLDKKGYPLNLRKAQYALNLVGVRSADTTPNVFNDWEHIIWLDTDGTYRNVTMKITTDPGLYWLQNPGKVAGTAILKEGHWKNMWGFGKHKGVYEALVQINPVTVIRDFDRDSELDYNSGKEETGIFGINNHRANEKAESTVVDKWSAGCQVVAKGSDYVKFMSIVRESIKYGQENFSYSLLNERDL